MNDTPPGPRTDTARSRRGRFAVLAGAILLCATVSMVSLSQIGARTSRRFDVTATGEHRLAPRTRQVIDALPPGTRIILALDKRSLEPGARAMLEDVLSTFSRAEGGLGADWIDTSGEAGRQTFSTAIRELADRQRASIDAYARGLRTASEATAAASSAIDPALAAGLEQIRDALGPDDPSRRAFEERAALFRVLARDSASNATSALQPVLAWEAASNPESTDAFALPPLDAAWQALKPPAENLDAQLDAISRELVEYANSTQGTPGARDKAVSIARVASTIRAPLARSLEEARAMRAPSVIRISRLIESDRAAVVVGESGPGIVGIDLDSLVEAAAAPTAEARGRVESLLATALGTLVTPAPPIVVLVHAENPLLLSRANLYQGLVERLSTRGIDTIMWSLTTSPDPPSLRDLDPGQIRPVVYVVLSTDSSTRSPGPGQPSGIERAQRIGEAVQMLFDRGESILLSVGPSVIPATGSLDPTTRCLTALGLICESGRPLVRERLTPMGRVVTTPITGVDRLSELSDHPIASAVRGLSFFMAWPIRIDPNATPVSGVTADPLLGLSDDQVWGESQWITLWQVGLDAQTTLQNPPSRDARDLVPDSTSPAPLAWAIERRMPDNAMRLQRLVAVGTHSYGQFGWFADAITNEQSIIDGRPVRTHPGNIELFDASISYLAGMDQLIAQSPEARSSPMIGPIAQDRLRLTRLALAAGMPLAVLLIGVTIWAIRR